MLPSVVVRLDIGVIMRLASIICHLARDKIVKGRSVSSPTRVHGTFYEETYVDSL